MTTVNFLHNWDIIHLHLGRGKRREETIFPKCGNYIQMKLLAPLLYSVKHKRGEISEIGEEKSNTFEHKYSYLQHNQEHRGPNPGSSTPSLTSSSRSLV